MAARRPDAGAKFMVDQQMKWHEKKVESGRNRVVTQWNDFEAQQLTSMRQHHRKDFQKKERFDQIDKENMRMLQKFMDIDSRRPGPVAPPAVKGPTTLNQPRRRKEADRINSENARLLKKIQQAKSSVSFTKLDNDHKRQQHVMRLRCEHAGSSRRHSSVPVAPANKDHLYKDPVEWEHFNPVDLRPESASRAVASQSGSRRSSRPASAAPADAESERLAEEQLRVQQEIAMLEEQLKGGLYAAAKPQRYRGIAGSEGDAYYPDSLDRALDAEEMCRLSP
eukprot:CAMPEP_0204346702 /NCGR_PEP_ID=MMETSP0469-20131031/27381_1 /ASSEMBLY_ACC=CAM_ASM_000384 /TAXON_ID=2969 /ORGANISM="Oxyrrhis marina" /LENGTH=279 /DNA_ID=CAMNT_0051332367 /DNA_START=40 /DNA_END=879 /DNA_ORIENTATION=-